MIKRTMKILPLLLALVIIISIISACAGNKVKTLEGTADNDILTFIPNPENKPIIRIGMQYYAPLNSLTKALQEHFPDYLFLLDHSLCAGSNALKRITENLDAGTPYDMIVAGSISGFDPHKYTYFIDLSAESYMDNFLLGTLNRNNVDGRIYSIPGASTLAGIAFNAAMFAQYGWEIPKNTDDFFVLCDNIKAAGINPFSVCFKYSSEVNNLLGMMCYPELYQTPKDALWLNQLARGESTYQGHMEPFYELAKRFADSGVISTDYFTASLTQQRQAFWEGETAMIYYDSAIYTYAESENPSFEIGFMPFPTKDSNLSGYLISPEYFIYMPKTLEKDPKRLAFMKEVFAFICTAEGQNAMMEGSLRISNIKGVELADSPAQKYAQEACDKGNLYPAVSFDHLTIPISALQKDSIQTVFEGGSVADAIAMMDESIKQAFTTGVKKEEYEVIATAEENFSMLETSYYLADILREAAGADIGLMVNGGYFCSNLATIQAGPITSDMSKYSMKGIGTQDRLTTYKLTGAQIRELLEYPIINKAEIDVFIAASGLAITYAPWNERGNRVIKLTWEDGSELVDDQLYTVAAWAGAIAEQYISATVQTHDTLGQMPDILLNAFKQDETVKPDIADRVKLIWPKVE